VDDEYLEDDDGIPDPMYREYTYYSFRSSNGMILPSTYFLTGIADNQI
jgi:hypothetical protein